MSANQASISAAETLSDYLDAAHTGQHTLDIDFAIGVTGTVKIMSKPIGGVGKYLRYPKDNGIGDEVEVTGSMVFTVPGNRSYAIIATAKGGDAGLITATITEIEAPR